MKNSIIGNRTRDLPAFSTVSEPTGPPRAPVVPRDSWKCTVCEGKRTYSGGCVMSEGSVDMGK